MVEEIYELLEAETEMRYSSLTYFNKAQKMLDHITEEIADCYVVLEQHRLYWGISRDDIKEIFKQKVDRQLERMQQDIEKD